MQTLIYRGNVVVGIKVDFNGSSFEIALPDEYIGDGNDITAAILRVLVARRLAVQANRKQDYNNLVKDAPATAPALFILSLYTN